MTGHAMLPNIRIASKEGIVGAAERLRDNAFDLANLRVAAVDNIAADRFLYDAEGNQINDVVFGWSSENECWWTIKGVTYFSPATIGVRYESEPFWCNQSGYFTRTPNPALLSVDTSKMERFTGRKAAIVVPVHMPFGRIAAVCFHPEDPECNDLSAEYEDHADALERLARSFIIDYVKATETQLPSEAHTLLNPREVECLQWAAGGKTDSEIAMIIARSHATIRFHIRRAMEKLDAVNRSQAIFKAAQLGYLPKFH